MPYRLEWEPRGVIKHFWGPVTFEDVFQSEGEIQSSPVFDDLRFVISVFDGDSGAKLSKSESDHIHALRLGAAISNPRLRYAYVSNNEGSRRLLAETTLKSNSVFVVQIFDNLGEARQWVAT